MQKLFLLALCLALPFAAHAQTAQTDVARQYLQAHAKQHGITGSALAEAVVTDAYTSRHNGVTHVYLQQHRNGIAVDNAVVNVNVRPDGRVLLAGGTFVPGLEARALAAAPSIGAEHAAETAVQHVGLIPAAPIAVQTRSGEAHRATVLTDGGIAREPITAKLLYHPTEDGEVRLAWDVEIHEAERPHVWSVRVDAATGAVLAHRDQVIHDHWPTPEPAPADLAPVEADRSSPLLLAGTATPMAARRGSAAYRVFGAPIESPSHGERTLIVGAEDPEASPNGWHDDGVATYTTARGNNVHAYVDANATNSPSGANAEPDGGEGLLFDFDLDLTLDPSQYRPAAVTNLFFWNNLIHDVFFQYGFDEAAGNFQRTNYSGLGQGNDPVRAEAQDGGGTNNANFFTPSDGQPPRMQMFLWTTTNPRRDGDLDNGIIAHEYGHGISIRLTGGPSNVGCLNNSEQMGEGWSDYFGIIMTMNEGDTGPMRRGVGTYALNQPVTGNGIRPAPYSTDMAVNGYTYGNIGSQAVPHGVGFVWATIIWEMTWALIDAHGFDPDLVHGTGGNNIALQLVTDALKLQPCSPGFVDGRNAILAADEALYDGANAVYLWEAFAKRGLGYSASQGSSGSTSDGTEAFDLPPGLGRFVDLEATPDPVNNFEFVTYTLTFGNGEARDPLANVELTAALPENAIYVGGSASDGGYLNEDGLLTWPGFEAPTGFETTRTFTVLANADGETVVYFSDDMEDGDDRWEATHGAGSWDWSLNAGAGAGGSFGWFAQDVSSISDQYLTFAEPVLLESDVNLQFTHRYATETGYDGGVVEVSTNGGTTWEDLGSRMTENGYNGSISTSYSNPIGGRQAFTGSSSGYVQTVVDMADFTGQEVLVRFRLGTDSSVSGDGWYVDDVALITAPINVAVEACAPETETSCDESRVLVLGALEGTPALTVSDAGFDVAVESGASATVELTLGNEGERALDWHLGSRLAVPAPWASADAPNGTIETDGTTTVTLTLDAADLPDGVYLDTLAVYSNDPANLIVDVPVTFLVGTGVSSEDGAAVAEAYRLSGLHPNPFADRARFTLEVAEAQPVTVAVYDVMGREVARLHDGVLAAGTRHAFEIDGAALAAGVYLVRITGETFTETKRVTLLR
jgi:hypothetical protein